MTSLAGKSMKSLIGSDESAEKNGSRAGCWGASAADSIRSRPRRSAVQRIGGRLLPSSEPPRMIRLVYSNRTEELLAALAETLREPRAGRGHPPATGPPPAPHPT